MDLLLKVFCHRPISEAIVIYLRGAARCFLAILLMFPCAAAMAQSQVERLPPVFSPDELIIDPSVHRASAVVDPTSPTQFEVLEGEPYAIYEDGQRIELPAASTRPPLPPGAKDGMLQRSIFKTTWLPDGGSEGLGMTDLTGQLILAFPLYFRDTPLIVSPSFTAHLLDGPTVTDLPPRLYDATLEFRWMNQLTPRLGVDLSLAPNVFSDFENNSSDAFRITGRAIGAYQWTPATQIVFGAAYLGRNDFPVMPIAGLIYKQDPDTTWELVFPRPRLLRRFNQIGDIEYFWYAAGEFGGNTYAIQRASGADDQMTYSDWRVLVGIERKVLCGLTSRIEAGYVFTREVEYESGTPGFDPTSTALVRAELSY